VHRNRGPDELTCDRFRLFRYRTVALPRATVPFAIVIVVVAPFFVSFFVPFFMPFFVSFAFLRVLRG
jgi:hypothetical protein